MQRSKISILGFALLGLLHQKPQSGYELCKVFRETPMGSYSDSPGAIYPALRRLERDGFITGTLEESGAVRRRRVYQLTNDGESALKFWLQLPIDTADIRDGADELMLRFCFLHQVLGVRACRQFLRAFGNTLKAYIAALETSRAQLAPAMSLSARLALDFGITSYQGMQEWVQYALKTYEALPEPDRPAMSEKGKLE